MKMPQHSEEMQVAVELFEQYNLDGDEHIIRNTLDIEYLVDAADELCVHKEIVSGNVIYYFDEGAEVLVHCSNNTVILR